MSKKKRGNKRQGTQYGYGVSPEFKKRLTESHESVIDFSDAPDEMRLSDRILHMIDPYMESMDINLLVDCATIAWNECVNEDFCVKGPYSLNNALINFNNHSGLIDELKARKRLMFKKNSRHIKEVKVYANGDDMSINVASSFAFGGDLHRALSEPMDDPFIEANDEEYPKAMEPYDDDGDTSTPNPRLKHILLSVVDNQLRDNTPPIARETFERLQTEGYTAEQAKEKIAAILVEDIYEVMTTNKPHDEVAYETRLKALK